MYVNRACLRLVYTNVQYKAEVRRGWGYADQVSNEIQCLIGSTQKRSVDGAIQRATRSDMRVPLHTGWIQDGGGMETNRRTAIARRTEVDMRGERMRVSGYPRSGRKHAAGQNVSW